MVDIDLGQAPAHQHRTLGLLQAIHGRLRSIVGRQRERRMIATLSRLPPRLIRDMGLDPERVYAELDGTWDELPSSRWGGPVR